MKKILDLLFVLLWITNISMPPPMTASSGNERPQAVECNGYCFYEEVLDHVFPAERPGEQRAQRVIRFRVLPTENAEWQVVIREGDSGKFQVVAYNVDKKQTNIGSHIGRMASEGKLKDLDSVLHEIHITEKIIDLPSRPLQEAIKRFFEMSIPTDLDKDVFLDGATFELWEGTASNQIHVSISGPEPNEISRLKPLPLWMVQVTSLIASASGRESILPITDTGKR